MDAKCKLIQLALEKVANAKYGIKSLFNNTLFNKFFINDYPECNVNYPIKEHCLKLDTCENGIVYENEDCLFDLDIDWCLYSLQDINGMLEAEETTINLQEIVEEGVCYDDWFLGSRDSVIKMFQILHFNGIGNFNSSSYYWTSSEYNDEKAMAVLLISSFLVKNLLKTTTLRFRPIRLFYSQEYIELGTFVECGWVFSRTLLTFPANTYLYYMAAEEDIIDQEWGTMGTFINATTTDIAGSKGNTSNIVNQIKLLAETNKAALSCFDLEIGECGSDSSSSLLESSSSSVSSSSSSSIESSSSSSISESSSSISSSSSSGEICYNDWYLPAYNQIAKIITEIHDEGLGSFSGKLMCSTTNYEELLVETFYYWNFNNSVWVANGDKSTNYKVRPVRDFESTEVYALRDVVGGGWIYDIDDLGGGNFKYYVVPNVNFEIETTFGTAGIDTFITDADNGKQNTSDILFIEPTAPAALYCDTVIICEEEESSSSSSLESSSSSSVESSSSSNIESSSSSISSSSSEIPT